MALITENELRARAAEAELALGELTDFQAAEAMRDGKLPSPMQYDNFWLFDLRITGTGAAYRDAKFDKGKKVREEEYSFRDPGKWLSEEFVARCNGLTVVFEHPEKSTLNSEEFRERSIGTIVLPYVKDAEVWGIAKIFDADAAHLMQKTHISTSPGVTTSKGSTASLTDNGTKVLDENLPLILDHLAVCTQGVWDKGQEPSGIRLDAVGAKEQSVDEAEKKRLEDERKALQDKLDAANRRADAAEAKAKEIEDSKRKDAEAEAERVKVEKEAQEKADRKKRHDAERMDGESEEAWEKRKVDARKDETEAEREEREGREKAAEAADKAKKDAAAATETVNANVEKLNDARRADSKRLEDLEAEIARLKKQPTMDDANAIASAYHRYDSIYQMLGERVPQHMPGESPIAYRRRLADGLRKHTRTWKEHVIHDAVAGPAFDMIEQNIVDEALAEAKNPTRTDANAGRLIERTTTQNGKTRTEFYGDSAVAYAPFEAPVMSFKFKKPSSASAR
jgi:hypothetical protein